MPIMKWNNELSVNIKEIDDQHKRLIDLINILHDACWRVRVKRHLGYS